MAENYTPEEIEGLPAKYARIPLKFTTEHNAPASADDAARDGDLMTREQFAQRVRRRIEAAVDARKDGGFDDAVREFRAQYRQEVPEKSEPWEGCSNLSVPLTGPVVDSVHAQIYKTITGVEPIFRGVNSDPNKREDTELKERALEWIMRVVSDFPTVLDEWLLRALIDRTGVLQIVWEVKVEKQRSYQILTPELFNKLKQRGLEKQLAGKNYGDEMVVTDEVITREATKFNVIDLLDFVCYPADAPNIQAAQIVGNRYRPTRGDLLAGVKSGMYEEKYVKELLERAPNQTGRHRDEVGGDEAHVDELGITQESEVSSWDGTYEVFTALVKHDCDNDGLLEWALVDIEMSTGIMIRCELYPYFHDKPFYVLLNPYIDPGMLYGFSLPQKLEGVQSELNATHNQKVDRASLENNAPLIARKSLKSSLEGKKVGPGTVIFTDDPPKDAVVPLSYANGSQRVIQEEEFLKQTGYEAGGVNSTTVGQVSDGDNTFGEIERTLQSVNVKFDVIIDRVRRSCSEAANQTTQLYAQYQPDDFSFSFTGEMGIPVFETITRQQMGTEMGFVAQGTSALSNLSLQAQIAEKMFMIGERSPFTQADLTRLYELTRRVFKAYGQHDFAAVIGTPEQAKQLQMEVQNAPEDKPEEKVSITRKVDEVATLALMFKNQELTPEEYMATAAIAAQAATLMAPAPTGAEDADATDDSAGYEKKEKGNAKQRSSQSL